MIGRVRLRSLREFVETAIRQGVPGDLIETGVWRGGACILMRAALEALGDLDRRVFVANSSRGFRRRIPTPIRPIAETCTTRSRSSPSRSIR